MIEEKVFYSSRGERIEIFLDEEIGPPSLYRTEFLSLSTATENDEIIIHINTPGGDLDTTTNFIHLMKQCEATITTNLVGNAYSGGSMIFMHGDEMIVHPHGSMMCHNASGGYAGKISDMLAHSIHSVEMLHDLVTDTYQGFLDAKELSDLLEGKEFWMKSQEILERMNKRQEVIEAQHEALCQGEDSHGETNISAEDVAEALKEVERENYKQHQTNLKPVEVSWDDLSVMKFKDAREICQDITGTNPKSWLELKSLVDSSRRLHKL
jgi:ATP-dependent protease ClpP protease subunit